jgi:2-amino-4-hydroxy-6-hydroxymethyldihydropteridine diphosphokinase
MVEVFVSVGSNVDRERHINLALDLLRARFGKLHLSNVYESPSVGFDGDPFFNLVVGFSTRAEPLEIVSDLRDIEARCGRDRREKRFGPRTMDLDLLLVGDRVLRDDDVVLPHEEISSQAFVLGPLVEIAGSRKHPVSGVSLAEMWADFEDKTTLRKVELSCGIEART